MCLAMYSVNNIFSSIPKDLILISQFFTNLIIWLLLYNNEK